MSEKLSGATTILLICREGKSRQVYQAELDRPGVSPVCVQALMEFFRRGVYCPLNGILVDMPTYMRSTEEEKRLLTELVGLFPALRLKCNESTGEIRTLPFGTAYPGNTSPAVFVQKYCTAFVARKIRTSERSRLHLPALLGWSLPLENLSVARSVTASISRGGCFLVSFAPWLVGDRGWLVLPDLNDTTPIPVEVCSIRLWGECNSLPGMGVKFIDLTGAQKDELGRLGGPSLMQDEQ
ncbi:MAG: PilZ domain-containing protein [Desulfuromonadaceae bacterium]|nr:PilZ domain-containing protein [Desulfuromonadaceae bacterium]